MPEAIACPKCGAESSVHHLLARFDYCCEHCREPLQELIELSKATWAEGDFTEKEPA